ncbi:MAG: alpha/beta fold hydrolase [Paracoccaceae bacterium]|nr:alpha/beta fold hydrolase [Paracoccaceae bacterium]
MRAIFLHAYAADRLTWAGTVPAMTGIACETLDLPGHGAALAAVGDGSLDALTAPIDAHLSGGDPAWLVGHSLGGGVALRLAAIRPEQVRGLVLIAPLGLGDRLDLEALAAIADIQDADEMQRFLERLVANPALIQPVLATYALEQLNRPGARAAMAKVAAKLEDAAQALSEDIRAVQDSGLPVTILWGKEDRVVQPDRARAEALGRMIDLDGAGHIAHVEALKVVNGVIRSEILGASAA